MTPKDIADSAKCAQLYADFKKRFSELPDFSSLNNEFEITLIEHEEFFLRAVIKRMAERLEGFSRMIEDVIQGDSTLSNMVEWKHFDEQSKRKVFETYRQLMLALRTALERSIDPSEQKEAQTVVDLWSAWQAQKPVLKDFIAELTRAWKDRVDIAEQVEYLG